MERPSGERAQVRRGIPFLYPDLFLPKCLIAASMLVFLLNFSFECGFFAGHLDIRLSFLKFQWAFIILCDNRPIIEI